MSIAARIRARIAYLGDHTRIPFIRGTDGATYRERRASARAYLAAAGRTPSPERMARIRAAHVCRGPHLNAYTWQCTTCGTLHPVRVQN